MNPFHGLSPSLLLLPAFAMILIVMAWGRPKRKDKAQVLPFKENHRTAFLSGQEAELNRERSWFGHTHRKAG
jgi:hypothetical protein